MQNFVSLQIQNDLSDSLKSPQTDVLLKQRKSESDSELWQISYLFHFKVEENADGVFILNSIGCGHSAIRSWW